MTVDRVTLVVVGAGMRGAAYARLAESTGRAKVVAVAEPDPERRARCAREFDVPQDLQFADWSDLAAAGRLANAAIIATQDRMHTAPTVAFAEQGYHILLEKPMATTDAEASQITAVVEQHDVIFAVCHVLRYTRYTQALKALLDSQRIGDLISVQHLEPIGWWHFAHAFVRGHWSNSRTSAPMLLTKCSHDIDWLLYLFGDVPQRVSSFGSLTHFRPENRPEGAGDRCIDCSVEATCPYSASRLYLGAVGDPDREYWPLSVVTTDASRDGVRTALRTSPYGRCVYTSENDVNDHQVVTMEFAGGATCSFTATAFTPMEHRRTRLFGTHGYIDGDGRHLRIVDFLTGKDETIDTETGADHTLAGGHGGGDGELVQAFVQAVASGSADGLHSDATTSLASHRVVWAAEHSRTSGTVVTLPATTP